MAAKPADVGDFWNWFQAHEEALLAHDPAEGRMPRQMWVHLYWINPTLGVRFGAIGIDGKRELIFTGNGFPRVYDDVVQVVRAAPDSDHWRFRAFLPSRWPSKPLSRNGYQLDPQSLYVLAEPWDDERLVITLFVEGLTGDMDQRIAVNSMARELVASALGEVEFSEFIANVEVGALEDRDRMILFPFEDLPMEIGRYFPDSNLYVLHAIAQGAGLE